MSDKVTLRELSGYIGVTEQRVLQLCQQGVIPRGEDKKIVLRDGVKAYIENLRDKQSGTVDDEATGLTFKNYAERDKYYQSEERRIDLLAKTGQLLHTAEVEEMFHSLIEITRESFLILPDVLEREANLSAKQIEDVQKYADKKLHALANEVSGKKTRD